MKRRALIKAGMSATLLTPMVGAYGTEPDTKERSEELYGLLGKLPPRDRKVTARLVSTEDRGLYTLEKLVLDLNGIEAAPAYFA
jgi:hypothetical protein